MSPIILKYLPFCASQLPVSLQCDKRLLAPSLNPLLLRPIPCSISARNRHHINLFFLLTSCCLHHPPLPQEVVYSGWFLWESYEHLTRCLWHFNILFQSMFVCLVCVFELLYVWLLSSKGNNTCVHFCTLYVCVVRSEGVCSVYVFKRKKEERKWNSMLNELWSMYRYLLCVVQSAWVNGIHVRKVQK